MPDVPEVAVPVVPAGAPVAPGRCVLLVALLADELSFFFASFRTYFVEPADDDDDEDGEVDGEVVDGEPVGEVADVSAAATQPTNVTSSPADARLDWADGLWGSCAATLIAAHANAANVIELSFRFIAPPHIRCLQNSMDCKGDATGFWPFPRHCRAC